MFGYIRIFKPQLKIIEYERYQGIYCALCKDLGKSYGRFTRISLSYDFAFLGLLAMAMDDEEVKFEKGRCVVNPLVKRCYSTENRHIDFTSAVAVILLYYKLKDNISDSSFIKSIPVKLALVYISRQKKKAEKVLPDIEKLVRECIEKQSEVEKAETKLIDEAADPSGMMLSGIAKVLARNEREEKILEVLGYQLGRWIYLMDAVDDIEDDLKSGDYNPYIFANDINREEPDLKEIQKIKEYSILTLNASLSETVSAYDLLEINRFDGIIRNILELGMPACQNQVVYCSDIKSKNKN